MDKIEEIRYIVYLLTNKTNGKMYVGMTSCEDPNDRWKKGHGYKKGSYIKNAINKYGWDGFTHEIIHSGITKEDAEHIEIKMIADLNLMDNQLGYNIAPGGQASMKGRKHTEESKRKISEAAKKQVYTDEWRRNLSKANSGKNSWNYGKPGVNRKKVICINDWVIYDSLLDASNAIDVAPGGISLCCSYKVVSRGKSKDTGDPLIWRYLDDYLENGYIEFIPEVSKRLRKVICLTTNKVFVSMAKAAKEYGIKNSCNIGFACRGERRYCGLHTVSGKRLSWMYHDEYLKSTQDEISEWIDFANSNPDTWVKVICTTTGEVFDSTRHAARRYGVNKTSMIDACSGLKETCGLHPKTGKPLTWMRYEEYIKEKH